MRLNELRRRKLEMAESLAAGEACKAIFRSAPGFKKTGFDSPGLSANGTWASNHT